MKSRILALARWGAAAAAAVWCGGCASVGTGVDARTGLQRPLEEAMLFENPAPSPYDDVPLQDPGPSAASRFSFSDELDRARVLETRKLLPYQNHDYLVGPDDVLEISVFEWDLTDQTRTLDLRVSKTGLIALPSLGNILVAGKSVEEINEFIIAELENRNILQSPRVALTVKEYRNRRISVLGAVNAPGVYALQENVISLMEVISLAGGPAADAAAVAYVQRTQNEGVEPITIKIDLDQLFKTGQTDMNPILRRGDSVFVPAAPLVYLYGLVETPGAIPLRRPTTVLESIALSGGFAPRADKYNVSLVRKKPDGGEAVRRINVAAMEQGKVSDLHLQAGDVLRVTSSGPKNLAYGAWEVFARIFSISYRLDSNSD